MTTPPAPTDPGTADPTAPASPAAPAAPAAPAVGFGYFGIGRPLKGISEHHHKPKRPKGTREQGERSLDAGQPSIG